MKKYLLTALVVLGLAATVHASPVGLTSEADLTEGELWADNDMGLSIGFMLEGVSKKDIDIDCGDFEMNAYYAKLGLSVLDRINFYVDLGQATDIELRWEDRGDKIIVKCDDETLWGIGLNALVYRWDNGLEVGIGASYRTSDMTLKEATVAGALFTRTDIVADVTGVVTDGDYEELQGAVELGWRTEYFTPYIGIKFSDVEVDADFTVEGQQHKATGKGSDQTFGIFTGLTIAPKIAAMGDKGSQLAINLEARFVDEEAISAGVTYKF